MRRLCRRLPGITVLKKVENPGCAGVVFAI